MPVSATSLLCTVCILLLLSFLLPAADIPLTPPERHAIQGYASWYGGSFNGRRAASGENYDMLQLTAAHRTLPFGCRVRVHRLDNDESVIVRINDRGPYVGDRIIDLSLAAARKLSMTVPGVVPVTLELLDTPQPEPVHGPPLDPLPGLPPAVPPVVAGAAGSFAVQVGSFLTPWNAERTRKAMQIQFGAARMVTVHGDPDFYRVLVGPAATRAEAEAVAAAVRGQFREFAGAYVVQVGEELAAVTN